MAEGRCLPRGTELDSGAAQASLLQAHWVSHHVSFSKAAAPLPGPQVMSLLLASSCKLSWHVYLKVMGIWLLCSTSSVLLLGSQVGLVSLSFLSMKDFPGPRPLQPKVASPSLVPEHNG